MAAQNKIKIDSFFVDKMRPEYFKDALKLAIKAQSSFGLTDKVAPSLFFEEIKQLIIENIDSSFVFKTINNKIFAIFIIKLETTISAELSLVLSDPNITQTKEMYDTFINILNSSQFKIFFARVYKKRKKFKIYLKFLNNLGFTETANDNEEFTTVSFKKA